MKLKLIINEFYKGNFFKSQKTIIFFLEKNYNFISGKSNRWVFKIINSFNYFINSANNELLNIVVSLTLQSKSCILI